MNEREKDILLFDRRDDYTLRTEYYYYCLCPWYIHKKKKEMTKTTGPFHFLHLRAVMPPLRIWLFSENFNWIDAKNGHAVKVYGGHITRSYA